MAIVAEVGPDGWPTKLFEQCADNLRFVVVTGRDLRHFGGDTVIISHPEKVTSAAAGLYRITIVNNASAEVNFGYQDRDGKLASSFKLTAVNTEFSFMESYLKFDNPAAPNAVGYLVITNSTGTKALSPPVALTDGTGYEIYSDGKDVLIRPLKQLVFPI